MILCYRMMFLVLGVISTLLGIYFLKSEEFSFINEGSQEAVREQGKKIGKVFGYSFLFIAGVSVIGLVFTFFEGEESVEMIMNKYFLIIIFTILIMSMILTRIKK